VIAPPVLGAAGVSQGPIWGHKQALGHLEGRVGVGDEGGPAAGDEAPQPVEGVRAE
jgi:hypothetical protein